MESVTFIFLAVLDNRVTELVKKALTIQFPGLKEETVSLLVLFISFVIGVLGVILIFPSANVFVGQGVTTLAEQVATGIVIGGLANGINFMGERIARPESTSKATLSIVQTEEKTALTPAA